jgi:hypothetical protein
MAGAWLYRQLPPGEQPGHLGGQFGGRADLELTRVHQHRRGNLRQGGPGHRRVEGTLGVNLAWIAPARSDRPVTAFSRAASSHRP